MNIAALSKCLHCLAILPLAFAVSSLSAADRAIVVTRQFNAPVLTTRSAGAQGNKYGFEGGRVIKLHGVYHLFTSEMVGDPHWVRMKLAHWTSRDRLHWRRIATLRASSGNFTGTDQRAALWSPMPVFDPHSERWNLFYVAYQAAPDTPHQWLTNHEGRIWRAVSTTPGIDGIGGPYKDAGVVLERGKDSDPWEGLQGTDSFFPYLVDNSWYALYGSAQTQTLPIALWQVGLARATSLGGPWTRCSHLNPLHIEPRFIENPIVSRLAGGAYVAVYDDHQPNAIGYSFSGDGVHWFRGRPLVVQSGSGVWAGEVRTPLGLIDEGNGSFTLFYSANEKIVGTRADANGITMTPGAIGVVEVRLQEAAVPASGGNQ
ncbi:MAG TPA: hypothetical protein VHX20_10325 [Terracidiphilus sp.]|jgi:hypothetical protein|nr:hypothetical protein [Terracidiphilus sp.]